MIPLPADIIRTLASYRLEDLVRRARDGEFDTLLGRYRLLRILVERGFVEPRRCRTYFYRKIEFVKDDDIYERRPTGIRPSCRIFRGE